MSGWLVKGAASGLIKERSKIRPARDQRSAPLNRTASRVRELFEKNCHVTWSHVTKLSRYPSSWKTTASAARTLPDCSPITAATHAVPISTVPAWKLFFEPVIWDTQNTPRPWSDFNAVLDELASKCCIKKDYRKSRILSDSVGECFRIKYFLKFIFF